LSAGYVDHDIGIADCGRPDIHAEIGRQHGPPAAVEALLQRGGDPAHQDRVTALAPK
jgi:hypothetical protein